jgi:hypothetical protein
MELESARAAFMGNKAVQARLGHLFDDLERKVRALNEGHIEDDTAEDLDIELQKTLTRLRSVVNNTKDKIFDDANFQSKYEGKKDFDQKLLDVYFMKQQFAYSESANA